MRLLIATDLHQRDVGAIQASPPKSDELNRTLALNICKEITKKKKVVAPILLLLKDPLP